GPTHTSATFTNGTLAPGVPLKLPTRRPPDLGTATSTAEDIPLGTSGDLTLNSTGAVTQTAGNVITAQGLQLLGSGTVNLDETANDVTTPPADYSDTTSYRAASTLTTTPIPAT